MALGNAGTWPQKKLLIKRLGVLCSQRFVADELCEYIRAELGVHPEVLEISELSRIDVLIVAENTIGAAVYSVERVRRCGHRMPLMVVTLDDHPAAIERAVAAGADDFVNVRSRKAELPHRLTAIRRRASGLWTREAIHTRLDAVRDIEPSEDQNREEKAPISTRGITFINGVRIVLTARESSMLQYLKARPRTWVTAGELLTMVCDCPQQRDSTLVRVHLSAIRKKLGAYAQLIESRRTYGYRWVGAPDKPL
jgi:DNA-binding response OmpR family regulator